VTDISPETRLIKAHFCEQPRIAARLPKGDVLLAGSREDTAAFSIGGSRLIEGPALIVGRLTGPVDREIVGGAPVISDPHMHSP
jgi:hypothetical protein